MKFDYHAVSKKDRIIKTLLYGVPASLVLGVVGAFAIKVAISMQFNIIYYVAILGIGYLMGMFVRKVGRGTTSEFLVIAAVLSAVSAFIAMYLYFIFSGIPMSINGFTSMLINSFFSFNTRFSLIDIILTSIVGVAQANTVQIR